MSATQYHIQSPIKKNIKSYKFYKFLAAVLLNEFTSEVKMSFGFATKP